MVIFKKDRFCRKYLLCFDNSRASLLQRYAQHYKTTTIINNCQHSICLQKQSFQVEPDLDLLLRSDCLLVRHVRSAELTVCMIVVKSRISAYTSVVRLGHRDRCSLYAETHQHLSFGQVKPVVWTGRYKYEWMGRKMKEQTLGVTCDFVAFFRLYSMGLYMYISSHPCVHQKTMTGSFVST